jgi:transmembrane sensor
MHDVDWDLLFRYLGKECTADEQGRVEAWLAADARHRVILEAAAVAGGRALESMPASSPRPRIVTAGSVPRRRSSFALAAAASLVLMVGGTLVWRALGPSGRANAPAPTLQIATTGRGARDTLRLNDGTRVVLGAASTLRYPADFTGRSRDVYLEGVGYFEVVHDSDHPFRVHAGSATAEDLGTAFSVRAYAEDASVQVVVAEGEVALGAATSGQRDGALLTRGQLGQLGRGETRATVRDVDVGAYLGWMRGRLSFEETPLPEVVAQLGRWYDVEFRIADPTLAPRRLTGSFSTESLRETLAVLGPALDVRFERRGDTLLVHPQDRRR